MQRNPKQLLGFHCYITKPEHIRRWLCCGSQAGCPNTLSIVLQKILWILKLLLSASDCADQHFSDYDHLVPLSIHVDAVFGTLQLIAVLVCFYLRGGSKVKCCFWKTILQWKIYLLGANRSFKKNLNGFVKHSSSLFNFLNEFLSLGLIGTFSFLRKTDWFKLVINDHFKWNQIIPK